ncbi:MAG TPA: TonB-dependent receptor [Terriglobia bacterium]|nr:TonB-dependent receptor [Terriglobia bacterium]
MRCRAFLTCAFIWPAILTNGPNSDARQALGTLLVEVRNDSRPVEQAEVSAGGQIVLTDARGDATLELPPGEVELTIGRYGFTSRTVRASVSEGTATRVTVELEAESVLKQEITVTATRTETRIEDQPLRVEVLDQEEIEEKTLMTPGDIAMLLNETSGLRVQVTAPSLGAANIRVQGLRGRYTQLLADGLPLYGGQTGAIGLLQIPPLDLGRVEVIKGVASALYGSSALGGVVNLVSRRPQRSERELLLNQTTRGGTDSVFWIGEPVKNRWGYTLLGGAHYQKENDIDGDGWADLAGYRRAVIRPRLYFDDGAGRSLFITTGATIEERRGGTIGTATVSDGHRFPEELDTQRFDTGIAGRFVLGKRVVSIRGAFMTQHHRHQFGDVIERDRHETSFGEASISGTSGKHTWAIGSALQADLYRSRDVSRFDYTYIVPAVFVQDDYALGARVTLSASARLDAHNVYGGFFNPRISALFRPAPQWTVRVSTGTGVFAPTPFTEETEAVGLSRLLPRRDVKPERARSLSGDLGWSRSHLELNGTLFGSVIHHPVMLRQSAMAPPQDSQDSHDSRSIEIFNANGPTRTAGSELLARLHGGDFTLVLTHTIVHSTEIDRNDGQRRRVPLTPKYTASIVGMWEKEAKGRIGLELFYTGRQRLEDNPYRSESVPYWVFGMLVERRLGPARLFVNAENLLNVRQTRYDPLLRPQQHFDGAWTVDAWTLLEGRVLNAGLRFSF